MFCITKVLKGLFLALLILLMQNPLRSQVFPEGFSIEVVSQFENPISFAFINDSSILVTQQKGEIELVVNGEKTHLFHVHVEPIIEKGLNGVAIDPDFEQNGFIYLVYTNPVETRNRISRFCISGYDTMTVEERHDFIPSTELIIYELDRLKSYFHLGGEILFGGDGKLYFTTGDNSSNPENAQNFSSTHGKIYRINSDGTIPENNPFRNSEPPANAFWALGFRNPFSFDIDSKTGKLFVNDVGKSTFEEINEVIKGGNYGWPEYEGPGNDPDFIDPIHYYLHEDSDTSGNAIVGGAFFNPIETTYPQEYLNKYFFTDFRNGWLNTYDLSTGQVSVFSKTLFPGNIRLKTGMDGNLYFLNREDSKLYRVVYNPNPQPAITIQPEGDKIVEFEGRFDFHVNATGSYPLAFQWYKNGNKINRSTARSEIYTIWANSTDLKATGDYHVLVMNELDTISSDTVRLEVYPKSARPTISINSPIDSTFFAAGDTVHFEGQATDDLDGPLSNLFWTIDLFHRDHHHDQPPIEEASGSFVVPRVGETDSAIWYRFSLHAENSRGLKTRKDIILLPIILNTRFETTPAGLNLSIDGPETKMPKTLQYVEGMDISVKAPSTQHQNSKRYDFSHWTYNDRLLNKPNEFLYRISDSSAHLIAHYFLCESDPAIQSFLLKSATANSLTFDIPVICGDLVVVEQFIQGEYTIIDTINSQEWMVSGLDPYTEYIFRAKAYNEFGESDYEFASAKTKLKLLPPEVFSAEAYSSSRIDLLWSTWDWLEGNCQLERDTSSTFDSPKILYVGNKNSFSDVSLSSGSTYYYRIKVYLDTLSSDYSEHISETTLVEGCIVAPEKPLIDTTIITDAGLSVQWRYDHCATVAYVEKFKMEGFVILDTLNASSLIFTDQDFKPGQQSIYRLQFSNQSGFSEYSDLVWSSYLLSSRDSPVLSIMAFPNPTDIGEFFIKVNQKPFQLNILSMDGKEMGCIYGNDTDLKYNIDTSGYSAGTYILHFRLSDNRSYSTKIVIK